MRAPFFWLASGIVDGSRRYWSVDVIYRPKDEVWTVFCSVSDADSPSVLTSRFAYTNSAPECDALLERGFPALEGEFVFPGDGTLSVRSPVFDPSLPPGSEMDYDGEALRIEGLTFPAAEMVEQEPERFSAVAAFTRSYRQPALTPDPVRPDQGMRRRTIQWPYSRACVLKDRFPTAKVRVPALRWPTRAPFDKDMDALRVWTGGVHPPRRWPTATSARSPHVAFYGYEGPDRVKRPGFGTFEFEFDDVEVLGFRVAIPTPVEGDGAAREATWRKFLRLVEPLNFHLEARTAAADRARPDFLYRPASPVLNIELLRYGRMARPNQEDGREQDYQAQHELLVRVVIGRVDQDGAQAHEPATFVPAIFVDNRWSKSLGRQFLGMDKRLAHFCVGRGEDARRLKPNGAPGPDLVAAARRQPGLLPDGAASGKPLELSQITEVRLADKVADLASGEPSGSKLFGLRCDADAIEDWNDFVDLPGEALIATSALAPARRWRQEDFDEKEVRRSFARAAVVGANQSFRAIQATPIGREGAARTWAREKTWITARYNIKAAKAVSPDGVLEITLHNSTDAPPGWRAVCDLLGVPTGTGRDFVLPSGAWYRLKNAVSINLESGLE